MGFDFQLVRVTTDTTLQGRGSFAFNGVFSQDPQDRTRTGSPIADMLLGLPATITVGTRGISNERARNYFGYFQDDFTVTPALTLNLGIRYDFTPPFYETDNKFGNLILAAASGSGTNVTSSNPAIRSTASSSSRATPRGLASWFTAIRITSLRVSGSPGGLRLRAWSCVEAMVSSTARMKARASTAA